MSSKKDKPYNSDKYFMSIAMNLALERNGLTGLNPSVGCLIVKNNKILSFGQTGFNGRPHAEFEAIRKCKKKRFKWFLYLYYHGTLYSLRKNSPLYKFNY